MSAQTTLTIQPNTPRLFDQASWIPTASIASKNIRRMASEPPTLEFGIAPEKSSNKRPSTQTSVMIFIVCAPRATNVPKRAHCS